LIENGIIKKSDDLIPCFFIDNLNAQVENKEDLLEYFEI